MGEKRACIFKQIVTETEIKNLPHNGSGECFASAERTRLAGAKVALSGTREDALQSLAGELGDGAAVTPANLSDPDDVAGLMGAVDTLGPASGRMLARRMVGFVRILRNNGFPVGLSEAMDSLRLARNLDLGRRDTLRWALRSLLCASRTDWRRFDEIFNLYWLGHGKKLETRIFGQGARGQSAGRPDGQTPAGPVLRSERGAGGQRPSALPKFLLVLAIASVTPAVWTQVRYRPLSSFDDQPTRYEPRFVQRGWSATPCRSRPPIRQTNERRAGTR